ncbi:MAG: hypothetical protein ABSF84_07740 [Acidimicrobiales bacterium]|jgi:hypothetical protein
MADIFSVSSSQINYFDAHLADGSTVEIFFHVGNPRAKDGSTQPYVAVRLDRPGTSPVCFESRTPVARFRVGAESCHVLIGGNNFPIGAICMDAMQ